MGGPQPATLSNQQSGKSELPFGQARGLGLLREERGGGGGGRTSGEDRW